MCDCIELCACHECGQIAVRLLHEKTEVKQIGLDFPKQHRQSTCCQCGFYIRETCSSGQNILY